MTSADETVVVVVVVGLVVVSVVDVDDVVDGFVVVLDVVVVLRRLSEVQYAGVVAMVGYGIFLWTSFASAKHGMGIRFCIYI